METLEPHNTTTELLRRFLLWLAAPSTVGTVVELAILRHWRGLDQLLPWVVLAVAAITIGFMLRRPTPGVIKAARIVGVVVALTAFVGVFEHVSANYDDARHDRRIATVWATMSEPQRWLAAIDGTTGQAPPVAPGVLAQVGVLLAFATVRHPALGGAAEPERRRARVQRSLAAG